MYTCQEFGWPDTVLLTHTMFSHIAGTGCPLAMPYKGIRPFRQFLQWLDQTDESHVMNRSVVGGYFIYPPPPASLRIFMEERKGIDQAHTYCMHI